MEKPDVDHIEGLSPAISIEQKSTSHNPRSTVGTITEIYDYLRLLYARVGTPRCPDHGFPLEAQTVSQMVDQVLALAKDRRAPSSAGCCWRRWSASARASTRRCSSSCARRASCACASTACCTRSTRCRRWRCAQKHTIEAVIDRFKAARRTSSSAWPNRFETALKLGDGMAHRCSRMDDDDRRAAAVLVEVQLPGLRLLAARTRAAPVLVQLAGRRLPDLRRPGREPSSSIRRAWSCIRSCRSRPARCAAGTGATPTTSS